MNKVILEITESLDLLAEDIISKSEQINNLRTKLNSLATEYIVETQASEEYPDDTQVDIEDNTSNETEILNDSYVEQHEAYIVSVTGSLPGVDATHHVISMANFFSRKGYKVAVADFTASGDYLLIANDLQKGFDADYFSHQEVNYYPQCSLVSLEKLTNKYDYVIIDHGVFTSEEHSLFYRSDRQIVCTDGKIWNMDNLNSIFEVVPRKILENVTFLFNFALDSDKEKIISGMLPLKNVCFPAITVDPFKESDTRLFSLLFENCFDDPEEQSTEPHYKPSGFFSFLGRRRKNGFFKEKKAG